MNLLFLSTWYPSPPDNGSKLRVYYLLRGLAERHEVTLLSFAFATARPDAPGDLGNWCSQIQTVPLDPFAFNQAGTLRTFLSLSPMAARPLPAMSQAAARWFQEHRFDAIICCWPMASWPSACLLYETQPRFGGARWSECERFRPF